MKSMKIAAFVAALALAAPAAQASTFDFIIGDDDGYGEGLVDGGSGGNIGGFGTDQRSAAEMAATDGSEHTDINSAIFSPLTEIANFVFSGFGGTVTSATLTLDIGGLQHISFGETLARFNGVLQSGLLAIEETDFTATRLLNINLDATALANLNNDGFFDFEMDRNGNNDAIFIDYVRLSGTVNAAPVPLPASGLLLLGAFGAVAGLRRRKKA